MQVNITENKRCKFSRTAREDVIMIKLVKQLCVVTAVFSLIMLTIMLSGCYGRSGGVSSEVVKGTAAADVPLSGHVSLKDASIPSQEKSSIIRSDGTFAIDVTGMKAPYVLQAKGIAAGKKYTLHSIAQGAGTANINPLSDFIVDSAAGDDDPENVYEHADADRIKWIMTNFASVATILKQ